MGVFGAFQDYKRNSLFSEDFLGPNYKEKLLKYFFFFRSYLLIVGETVGWQISFIFHICALSAVTPLFVWRSCNILAASMCWHALVSSDAFHFEWWWRILYSSHRSFVMWQCSILYKHHFYCEAIERVL